MSYLVQHEQQRGRGRGGHEDTEVHTAEKLNNERAHRGQVGGTERREVEQAGAVREATCGPKWNPTNPGSDKGKTNQDEPG